MFNEQMKRGGVTERKVRTGGRDEDDRGVGGLTDEVETKERT